MGNRLTVQVGTSLLAPIGCTVHLRLRNQRFRHTSGRVSPFLPALVCQERVPRLAQALAVMGMSSGEIAVAVLLAGGFGILVIALAVWMLRRQRQDESDRVRSYRQTDRRTDRQTDTYSKRMSKTETILSVECVLTLLCLPLPASPVRTRSKSLRMTLRSGERATEKESASACMWTPLADTNHAHVLCDSFMGADETDKTVDAGNPIVLYNSNAKNYLITYTSDSDGRVAGTALHACVGKGLLIWHGGVRRRQSRSVGHLGFDAE